MTREEQLEACLRRIIGVWDTPPTSVKQFNEDMGKAIQEARALLDPRTPPGVLSDIADAQAKGRGR